MPHHTRPAIRASYVIGTTPRSGSNVITRDPATAGNAFIIQTSLSFIRPIDGATPL